MIKDYIQLEKWDDGVITIECANQDGTFRHFEFSDVNALIQFARDLLKESEANIEISCRPIQEPMGEYCQDWADLMLAAKLLSDTAKLIVDFILTHYPERTWNQELLEAVYNAVGTD